MNDTIPQVSQVMSRVLNEVAQRSARNTGFILRRSKLSGPVFVQTLVLGWLNNPEASLEALTQTTASLGVKITPQGLDQRFSAKAAYCMEGVLSAAVKEVVASLPAAIPAFERFSAVVAQDSSIIVLPEELKEQWPGCGGKGTQGQAALKLQVRLDLKGGGLEGPVLTPGRWHDQRGAAEFSPVPQGALQLRDLGYFNLAEFADMTQQGSYFISRLKTGTKVFLGEDGVELRIPEMLGKLEPRFDLPVAVGGQRRLKVRLIGAKAPPEVAAQRRRKLKDWGRKKMRQPSQQQLGWCDWTLFITNIPTPLAALEDVLVLARARWQVELLFKLWKQQGQIDEWRSQNPWRILCEVYAKLVAVIIQHWLLLVSSWSNPDRSLMKGAQTVRSYATMLVTALAGLIQLEVVMEHIARCIAAGCRMNRRKHQPNTYQLLLALDTNP